MLWRQLQLLLVCCLIGCGGSDFSVKGRVTCLEKPIAGSILFSPMTEDRDAPFPAVNGAIDAEGNFMIRLKGPGTYRIVISPSDVPLRPKPGEKYPCDLTPLVKELKGEETSLHLELSAAK